MLKIDRATKREQPISKNLQPHTCNLKLEPCTIKQLVCICGKLDDNLQQIERALNIEILNRGNRFQIRGKKQATLIAKKVLTALYKEVAKGHELNAKQLHLIIQQYSKEKASNKKSAEVQQHTIISTPLETICAKTANQDQYLQNIMTHDINFGIGPAGTGKTFLAVACAIQALQQQKIHRILLVRPVIEAGEKLGFLPGDLIQKIDPYLRPLYDALYEMLGFEKVAKLLEHKTIEIAPLAYMRGRTLNDAFIILDEGQNTTIEQMKMFLTRIGFNSKVVVTGDTTQTDLPREKRSGLSHAEIILKKIKEISFSYFYPTDVIRHPIVQKIITAYGKDITKDK